jgi:hypothetical protein
MKVVLDESLQYQFATPTSFIVKSILLTADSDFRTNTYINQDLITFPTNIPSILSLEFTNVTLINVNVLGQHLEKVSILSGELEIDLLSN